MAKVAGGDVGSRGGQLNDGRQNSLCSDSKEPVKREKLMQTSNPNDHYLPLHHLVPGSLGHHWESSKLAFGICLSPGGSVTIVLSRNNSLLRV